MITKEQLKDLRTIAVFGDIGSGKTALCYSLIELLKEGENVYFIKHPQPKILKRFGYKNLRGLEELERLNNCVLFWDEPQLTTSIYDKKSNVIIAKVCTMARQRNIILIMASSDTRVFTRHNEAFIDLWLIKDVDYWAVKRGSKIQKAIKENSIIDPNGFRLNINEFLFECRRLPELCGRHTFKLIDGWNDKLSKPYLNCETNCERVGDKTPE